MRERADSSSFSTPKWIYDVFLSFRGEDVRNNFVGFLYSALQEKGIYTFKDDERLDKGSEISPALREAIKDSRIALVIFSQDYASSSWCLEELVQIIECKNQFGQIVVPVFYDVEPSIVRKQRGSFGKSFEKYEADFVDKEKVERWRAALVEAANLSGWDVPNTANGDESKCIQQIAEDIMGKLGNGVSTDIKDLVGMESRMQKVNSFLKLGVNDVRFLGMWGMSGIGKTTIAKSVFDRISNCFESSCFLQEVGQNSKRHGLEHMQTMLLSEILGVKDLRIDNVYRGINMINRRLCYKRVLIVLDDIDHEEQLDALAGKHEWFGAGSRIIITTRNKHLLVSHRVDKFYRVSALSDYEAIQLFSRYAFKKNQPKKDYLEVTCQIVYYSGGTPLALKVLGSFLHGRDMAEWKSELDRLKRIPEDEIIEKLKVGYHGLRDIEKEIFLDIACFLNGKKKDSVRRILDSFNFYADIGIRVLIEKSLVNVSSGRLLMHQLVQKMGWHIVRQKAAEEPGRCSRLWMAEDICPLLARDMVTESIVGMWLDLSKPITATIRKDSFKRMNRLRLLKFHNVSFSQGLEYIPNQIQWLNWHGYPSKALPASFDAEKLVGLKLKNSRIVQLWKGMKMVDKLKFINLTQSQKLIRSPDFTGIPNLERLILEDCTSLVEIHPSVGFLKNLRVLNLKGCKNLSSLPKGILLESLNVFILSGCSRIKEFPEILGSMNSLSSLYLEATSIKDLPSSIEHLSNLTLLNLSYCKSFIGLPISIGRMTSLRALILCGCSKLNKLPEEIANLESLEELDCEYTGISELPSSLVQLKKLRTLTFRGCKGIASNSWSVLPCSWLLPRKHKGLVIPSVWGLYALVKLDLSDCNILDEGFSCGLRSLCSLEELNLGRNNFLSISSADIKSLSRLRIVELVGCRRLQMLPDLPSSIEEIFADDCISLQSDTAILSKYEKLYRVSFTNCVQLLQSQQASNMVDILWQHLLKGISTADDKFSICFPGNYIPSWFTYQNMGPSIAIELPTNWYNQEFMGFAFCVVFKYVAVDQACSRAYLKKMPNILFQLKIITRHGDESIYISSFCSIGAEENVDLQNVCMAYVPFGQVWVAYQDRMYSPNVWCKIEVSSGDLVGETLTESWAIRLVYKQDFDQKNGSSTIQESSESGKLGLSNAIFDGSFYRVKKRRSYFTVRRLPPEITSDDSGNEIEMFDLLQPHIHYPYLTIHSEDTGTIRFTYLDSFANRSVQILIS